MNYSFLQRNLDLFPKLHSRYPVYKLYIIIAEQNLDVLVFWVEIVLTILNYRHRVANPGVFQTEFSTHQILSLEV